MYSKSDLLDLVKKEYVNTWEIIANCDLNQVAHEDSGWRIKDILIHVSFHDYLRHRMVQAGLKGEVDDVPPEWQLHTMPDDLHRRNQLIYEQRLHYSDDRVLSEYQLFREKIIALYEVLPEEQFTQEIASSFGTVTIAKTVEWTITHDTHHRAEILKALE